MSEELLQVGPRPLGRYQYHKLGNSTLRQLRARGVVATRFKANIATKKPDGLITLAGGDVKAVVEYKAPAKLRTKKQIDKAVDQELEVARQLCKVLIVTSGEKTVWINALNGQSILSDDGTELTTLFDAKPIVDGLMSTEEAADVAQLIDKIDHSLDDSTNQISLPAVLDPSALAKTVWQKIWINTGKEPEKCLYNVVELFVFKFLSDLAVLKPHISFTSVYDLATTASAADALKHYANTCRKEVEALFPKGEDGTTIINGTIFVNEHGEPNLSQAGLFAEVLMHLQEYDSKHGSFKYIKREFKTRLYESFLRQNAGIRLLGQYFTPRNVVKAMVAMSDSLNLRPGARVCDPFCGVGGFLLELVTGNEHILKEFKPTNGVVAPRITIVGYDKGTDEQEDERTIILAKANMLIYLSDLLARYHTTEYLAAFSEGALNRVFTLLRSNLGTFAKVDDEPYDLILTNPPYVTSGSGSLKRAIEEEGLGHYYAAGGRGTESLAMEWIIANLKEYGRALVIVPDGLMNQAVMLSHIKRKCFVDAVVSLPTRTFYSTPRMTYILCLRRKASGEVGGQGTPVFTYLVSDIGETRDAKRFTIEKNDLVEMVALFNQFRGSPTSFVSASGRCKIIPFAEFDRLRNWMMNRRWSREERSQLGIPDDDVMMTGYEYAAKIAAVRERIARFEDEGAGRVYGGAHAAKAVSICDPAVFEFVRAKTGWTKRTLHDIDTGRECDYPVYTAAAGPVAHVNIEDDKLITCGTDSPLLSFASNGDGSAGTNFTIHRRPFYVSNDRTVIRVVAENVLVEFVRYQLRSMKKEFGFCFAYKATPNNLGDVVLDIPTDRGGRFDGNIQRTIVEKYNAIRDLTSELTKQVGRLAVATVSVDRTG